jgi:hypothetical protein
MLSCLLLVACASEREVTATSFDVVTSAATTAPTPTSTTAAAPTTSTTTTVSTIAPPSEYPPSTIEGLAPILDPLLTELHLRTARGSLIDRTDYKVTETGGHLALYLIPDSEIGWDQFGANYLPIAQTLVPVIFATWPGLESFDVCQQPYGTEGDPAPTSLTLLDVTREQAEAIDWETVTVAELFSEEMGLSVFVRKEIADTATWEALLAV